MPLKLLQEVFQTHIRKNRRTRRGPYWKHCERGELPMEELIKKLEEIIDFDSKVSVETWSAEDIKGFEKKHQVELPHDYKFYLQHYGNDYIKEAFRFLSAVELPEKTTDRTVEIDSFYGLYDDENNIENKIRFYKDILPDDLLPIGDLPGGDLVCLGTKGNKLGKIYFWFHELEGENTVFMSESFETFILSFHKVDYEKNDLDHITIHIGDKLNAFLVNASKKRNEDKE